MRIIDMKWNKIAALALCLAGAGVFSSCDDFFDVAPKDQLTNETFWRNSDDVDAAVTAAYNWWVNNYVGSKFIFYEDSYSDIGFNYTNASYMRDMGRGAVSSAGAPNYWRQYETIRRCNFVIENIDLVPEGAMTEAEKNNFLAQVRAIRGYSHAYLATWYGDAVIMDFVPETADDAKLPRDPEADVKTFALEDLNWAAEHINDSIGLRNISMKNRRRKGVSPKELCFR